MVEKLKIDMTAWYLNNERVMQLLGSTFMSYAPMLANSKSLEDIFSPVSRARTALIEGLKTWLQHNSVPSLCELIEKGEIQDGARFTIYHDFYGKGLKGLEIDGPVPAGTICELHNKLRFMEVDPYRLRIQYSPAGLCNASAWSRLSGSSRLFVFGYIERLVDGDLFARPYFIGDLHPDNFSNKGRYWNSSNYGEIHPFCFDSFNKAAEQIKTEAKAPNLSLLKSISERKIKEALGEILHEDGVPLDWGGERSDLFSSNLSYNGRQYSAAFLLKGPSKFHEMKVADLGKNGDQIDRLFTEPVQICVLQHCHKVSSAVRSTMKAYSANISDLRYFSIIDGYDTIRLLRAYGKCGL